MTINQIFFKLCLKRNILYIIGRYATIEEVNKYLLLPLHKKPYFPSLGISWEAQKDEANIIFSATFWQKKRLYFPSLKKSNDIPC